ncbi:MAG: hypothetical protein WDM92_13475 [Caulobacteraceae bacterium]
MFAAALLAGAAGVAHAQSYARVAGVRRQPHRQRRGRHGSAAALLRRSLFQRPGVGRGPRLHQHRRLRRAGRRQRRLCPRAGAETGLSGPPGHGPGSCRPTRARGVLFGPRDLAITWGGDQQPESRPWARRWGRPIRPEP